MKVFNKEYEILTPSGFKDFDGIAKYPPQKGVTLVLSNEQKFNCAKWHKLKVNGKFKPAFKCKGLLLDEINEHVIDVINNKEEENYYDILEVEGHEYLSSNIVSHNCEFIGSVSTLIDHHFLKTMESTKPMKIANLPEYIRIYSLPLKKEKLETEEWEYVASLDSGYGVYQDSTVLQIFLVKSNITAHQVAVISSNKLEIEEFCKKSSIILKKYHDPTLIIEQNGPGIAATNYFNNRLEYENLLHFDSTGNHMGLWASEKLKQNACILLKTYVQRKFLHIYDRETINELFSFGRVSQEKWGALGGNHDDHITAMYWIPFYLQSPMFYGNIVEVNMKTMEEDEYILKTEEDIREERAILDKSMKDKMDDMRKAATYLPKQINNPHRKDPNDDDIQGSGLIFKR